MRFYLSPTGPAPKGKVSGMRCSKTVLIPERCHMVPPCCYMLQLMSSRSFWTPGPKKDHYYRFQPAIFAAVWLWEVLFDMFWSGVLEHQLNSYRLLHNSGMGLLTHLFKYGRCSTSADQVQTPPLWIVLKAFSMFPPNIKRALCTMLFTCSCRSSRHIIFAQGTTRVKLVLLGLD